MTIADKIEIELNGYLTAFSHKNWEIFEEHLDEDFEYFTDGCIIQNKKQFINFLAKDKWKGSKYKLTDLKMVISKNEDLVISCYKIDFTGLDNGMELTVSAIETTVFCKKMNHWKIIHSHTSNNM